MLAKFLFPFVALLAVGSTAPAQSDVGDATNYYIKPLAKNAAAKFNGGLINANDGTLWIYKLTTTDCMDTYPCSTLSNSTSIIVSSTGEAAMNVAVPGGQILYVASTGELQYTAPNSQNTTSGAYLTGFSRVEKTDDSGEPYYAVTFKDMAWVGCEYSGMYQIYSAAINAKPGGLDCQSVEIKDGGSPAEPQAYEYSA